MDYKGQNQSGEKMFDFEAYKNAQESIKAVEPGIHDPNKLGNIALSPNEAFSSDEIVSIENSEKLNDYIPESINNDFVAPIDEEKISLDDIYTSKTINKKTMEQVNIALGKFKKNDNPASFVEDVYNMTEANLKNSYGRELGGNA